MKHLFYDRNDGLAYCQVCNGAEGSLPRECPGQPMTEEEQDLIMAGKLEYIHNSWWIKRRL